MREVLLAAGLLGCGTSTPLEPPVVDASVEDAPDPSIPRCGAGPWVVYSGRIFQEWDRKPWVGMIYGIDLCPELRTLTNEHGFAAIATTRGIPYSIYNEHPDLGRVFTHQRNALWSIHEERFSFRADPTLEPLDGSSAWLHVAVFVSPMTPPPCNSQRGLRVSVPGHPAARVRYLVGSAEVSPDDVDAANILIEGLPDAVDVTVEAVKPGCGTRTNWFPSDTGKSRTHAGVATQVNVELLELAMDAGGDG